MTSTEWGEVCALARDFAEQRATTLSNEGESLVRRLIERLDQLPNPRSDAESATRRWQLQGFEAMVGAVAYADRMSNDLEIQRDSVIQAAGRLCDESFPTDRTAMLKLQRVVATVYAAVAGIRVN